MSKPQRNPAAIIYLGRNFTDHTTTLAIDGVRYEYWFPSNACPDVIEHLAKHISLGKALAFAKRHATMCNRVRL